MPINTTKLRELISYHFNDDELHLLCVDLSISWDDLPPSSYSLRVTELIGLMRRRKREQELLDYLARERPSTNWDEVVLPEAERTEPTPHTSQKFPPTYSFANRHDDKTHIVSILNRECNLLLYGPSGIGKTYFALELLKEEWCKKKQSAYIDFQKFLQEFPYNPDCPAETTDKILQQIRQKLFGKTPDPRLNRDNLINGIAKTFRDVDQCGIVILDNADCIDPSVLHDLRAHVLPKLYDRIGDPTLYPRIIVISPYELPPLNGHAQVKFAPYPLQEFRDVLTEIDPYRDLLIQAHNKWTKSEWDKHDHALENLLNEWIDHLYELTAGHPEAIIRVLDFVGERTGFASGDVFARNKTEICNHVLEPLTHRQVAKHIVDVEKQHAFQLLWVFRYLSDSVYDELKNYTLDKPHWRPLHTANTAWNPLHEKGLLQADVPGHQFLTYRLSPLWRKLNNFILQTTRPDSYRQLHTAARMVYEEMVYDPETDENMMRISCFGEMLYHLTQEHVFDTHTETNRAEFTATVRSRWQKLAPYIHGKRSISEYIAKLQALLHQDRELATLLNQVGQDNTSDMLLDDVSQL